jgi:uncharacterized DUF497 family protein
MNFIWDEKKNRRNIKKHKVSFVQAAHAFTDPNFSTCYDAGHSSLGEDRTIGIGFNGDMVLLVSFTEPDPDTVNIISARKAKNHEVEEYYGNC